MRSLIDVLFITDNPWNENFDRRILDQAEYFKNKGLSVAIATLGTQNLFAQDKGIFIVQTTLMTHEPKLVSTQLNQNETFPSEKKKQTLIQRVMKWLITHSSLGVYRSASIAWFACLLIKEQFLIIRFKFKISRMSENQRISHFADSIYENLGKIHPRLIVGCDLPGIVAAAKITKDTNAKVWFDAHEFYSEQKWLNLGETERQLLREIEMSYASDVDLFSTVSSELLREMTKGRFDKRTQLLISNSPLRPFALGRESKHVSKSRWAGSSENILLFHGNLNSQRGIDSLIEVFLRSNVPNWRLLLVGKCDKRVENRIRDNEIQNPDLLMYLPPIPENEIPTLVMNCAAVAMPYRDVDTNTRFGFPNKLGDCIELKKHFIYSSNLLTIDLIASKYSLGTSFEYIQDDIDPLSFVAALENLSQLESKWNSAQEEVGARKSFKSLDVIFNETFATH